MVFFGHFVPSRSVNTYIHTFSPSMVYAALAMILPGSTGKTREEFLHVLRISLEKSKEQALQVVVSLTKENFEPVHGHHLTQCVGAFFDDYFVKLKPEFKQLLKEHFNATPHMVRRHESFMQMTKVDFVDTAHLSILVLVLASAFTRGGLSRHHQSR